MYIKHWIRWELVYSGYRTSCNQTVMVKCYKKPVLILKERQADLLQPNPIKRSAINLCKHPQWWTAQSSCYRSHILLKNNHFLLFHVILFNNTNIAIIYSDISWCFSKRNNYSNKVDIYFPFQFCGFYTCSQFTIPTSSWVTF